MSFFAELLFEKGYHLIERLLAFGPNAMPAGVVEFDLGRDTRLEHGTVHVT